MYLHNDRNLFAEVITETNKQTGITRSIIEKDYYVTMILKLLAAKNPEIVFKGGTSLSKCFHLINRFSEDIDITFSEHIGEARRKKLKYCRQTVLIQTNTKNRHLPENLTFSQILIILTPPEYQINCDHKSKQFRDGNGRPHSRHA